MIFLVFCDSKWNIFGVQTFDKFKMQLGLWELIMGLFCYLLKFYGTK